MLYFFTNVSVAFPSGLTTATAVKTLLTCLLTCPLPRFIKLFLELERQAANKALLHHIQGEILLLRTGGLKGRSVKSFQQVKGGETLKGRQAEWPPNL